MSFIDLHTNVSLGHTKIVGLGDEKLWLCPTLGGDKLDISGNGNHGTYNGGMGTVADTSNGGTRAYSFDGSDDYIQRNGDVCTSQTRSYSCWVKLDNVQSYQAFISSVEVTGSGTSQHKIAIGLTNSGNFSGNFQDGGGTATATSTTTASSGAWYHVAATFDTSSGHDCEVFVNGTSVATGSGSGNLPSINRIIIGATQRKSGQVINQFDGLIDDVRIFDRVLTTTEIKHLASKRGVLGSPRNPVIKKRRIFYAPTAPVTTTAKAVVLKKPKPSFSTGYARNASESANPNLWKGLVGAWMPSFGVTGDTLRDVSGNGNDGALTNMQPNGWESTKNGSSLQFDAFNDYVDINPDHANSAIGNQVSIEALVFPRQTNAYRVIGGGQDNTGTRYSCSFNVGALTNQFGFDLEAASGQVRLFTSASNYLNKWAHLFGTYDGNTARLYLNGRYKAGSSATSGNVVDFDGIVLGRDINLSAGRVFYGSMSLFRIYNRALSPTEIKQLYLNPAAPFERKQQTVGLSTAQAFNPYWGNQATQLAGTLQ